MRDNSHYRHTGNVNQSKYASMRWLYLVLGGIFFGLGVVGVMLPVMPTAPFVLLAAACWARGSERFYLWLINHKYMGKYIRDWEARRAVPRRAKWLACIMMTLSGTLLFFTVPDAQLWVAWTVALVCFCVGIYLWRLPDA
ncbi:YbaN family protein [Psychrobacter phenylpyruvicus]|uniref:Inner membrane protein n=1 Tax=Psychrobacter phenylpyruvicus TaxID=29432 RepID=A0A379LGT5_9GAMM|nr:YbaN family protein [Psychrobacter phenylpyruvicus]SUD89766.1 Inner membrane protein ybaN [Psychrobacter phenylpyruvicus]